MVRLTADLLRVPVVQLNVITADQQVPVSHAGGERWGQSVDLSRSYCEAAIHTGERLVVEDARTDARFASSASATEGALVAPLLSPRSSAPLATLCVVDFVPRQWTEREIAHLADRIFDRFVQVRSDLTRTAEGTGLGLAISRDLARAMHGDLAAESRSGEGSVFTLTLPVPDGET